MGVKLYCLLILMAQSGRHIGLTTCRQVITMSVIKILGLRITLNTGEESTSSSIWTAFSRRQSATCSFGYGLRYEDVWPDHHHNSLPLKTSGPRKHPVERPEEEVVVDLN